MVTRSSHTDIYYMFIVIYSRLLIFFFYWRYWLPRRSYSY